MADYDIVISLNPTQPVAGAAKVTEAVAKIETQSKETQKSLDAISLKTKEAQDALSAASEKATAKFKQYSAAGAAAWGLLDQKLKLTDTAAGQVVDSAVKFGTIGAQVAGPWGAAIGAIGGALLDLGSHFDNIAKQAERMIDAANAPGIYRARQAWLESALAIERVGAQLKALEGLRVSQALAAAVPGLLAVNEYNEELKRQKDLYEKITGSRRDYHAQVDSLNAMLKAGKIDATQFNAALKELNKTTAKTGGERQYYNGVSPLDAYDGKLRKGPYLGLGERADGNPFEQSDLSALASSTLNERIKANAEETLRLAASTRAWKQELAAADSVLLSALEGVKQMSNSFVDTLVDGAFGADVSWKKWGEDMLKMFAKLILQASLLRAIGSPTGGVGGTATGLYKLLGFASGGVIGPRGGGAADTETAMFRVAPRETIRIHTPEQEAAYARGGGGPAVNIVNTPVDDRALLQALSGPSGAQTVMNVVRSNRRAIKALLDG